MKKYFKISIICVILLLAIVLVPIFNPQKTYAENTDLVIDLDSESKFDIFNGILAYTSGTSLYIAKDNTILSKNKAFEGKCLDIAINGESVLLLYEHNSSTNLKYFKYTDTQIEDKSGLIGSDIANKKPIAALSTDQVGAIYFISQKKANYASVYKFVESTENNESGNSYNEYEFSSANKINDFCFDLKNTPEIRTPYIISNGKVMFGTSADAPFETIDFINNATALSINNDKVYVNTQDGKLYELELKIKNQVDPKYTLANSGKSIVADGEYLYALHNLAIVKYALNTTLDRICTFDNSQFVHPTNFDILNVHRANETLKVYSSPKNLQVKSTINANDNILILSKYFYEPTGTEYYYVCTKDNELGYILSSAAITKINANSDVASLPIGLYAQGLHESTVIYKYPFSTSDELIKVDRFSQLVVIDNVAEVDSSHIWDYYKVSFVKDGEILTGYVKSTDVSPYCQLKAPQILKNVKTTTASVGETIKVYALPSEEALVVGNLVDGVTLKLAEEYNENSEWTKVIYKDAFAYVKTNTIQKEGLTTLQITIIVICCIVFISSLIMVLIIVRRRRFGY